MDRQDEEFEAFLRQFRPRPPRPLPAARRTAVVLSTAALVAAVLFISVRLSWKSPPATRSPTPASSTPLAAAPAPPSTTLTRVQETAATLRGTSLARGAARGRVRVPQDVSPPAKVFDVRPIYPQEARDAGIQGVVIVGVVIGEDGGVVEAQVMRSIPELDQAALDAVRQWQFAPTVVNGQPVEVEMAVAVNFTLQ